MAVETANGESIQSEDSILDIVDVKKEYAVLEIEEDCVRGKNLDLMLKPEGVFEIQLEGDDAVDGVEVVDMEEEMQEEDQGEDVPDTKVTQKQANTYAAKKTVAQGMMDIALITANANQLRYIIEFNSHSPTYYLNLFLITISLLLQVAVGISLIFKGRLDLKGQSKNANAKKINNYVVVGIFLVTIINVFIASFTITGYDKHGKP